MKIIYLSKAILPSRNADGIHIMKMCAAFARNGHQVKLIAPTTYATKKVSNNEIFQYYGIEEIFQIKKLSWPRIKYRHIGDYLYAVLILFEVIKYRPTLIFSRFFLGSFIASFIKIPQIYEYHAPIPKQSRIQKPMFENLIKKFHFKVMVVITEALKQMYIEDFPAISGKIIVAPDAADLPRNYNISLKVKKARLQIGYVGHLYKGRGIELIIQLAKECNWADFHIVGGEENDINRVKKETKSFTNIIVHGFKLPAEAEIIRLEMDVLLAPYQEKVYLSKGNLTTERWMSPLKIFEYMAAGKAIISSNLPVLHEVLKSGYNCILCPANDCRAWLNAVIQLNEDESLRSRLAKNALKDLLEKYTWDARVNNILNNTKLVIKIDR